MACAELVPGFGAFGCNRVLQQLDCPDPGPCRTAVCNPLDGQCVVNPVVCDRGDGCSVAYCDGNDGQCKYLPPGSDIPPEAL